MTYKTVGYTKDFYRMSISALGVSSWKRRILSHQLILIIFSVNSLLPSMLHNEINLCLGIYIYMFLINSWRASKPVNSENEMPDCFFNQFFYTHPLNSVIMLLLFLMGIGCWIWFKKYLITQNQKLQWNVILYPVSQTGVRISCQTHFA